MIYVPVPKEIKEFEKKAFKNLTVRQLVWLSIGTTLALIAYFLLKPIVGNDAISYIIMVIVIPCFMCGFIKIQDMPFDIYVKIVFFNMMHIQKLTYDNDIRFFIKKEVDNGNSKKKKRRKQKIKETI